MVYKMSTLKKKARESGYSLQYGRQHYLHEGWGIVRDVVGEPIMGYQIYSYSDGALVAGYDDIKDHTLTEDEAVPVKTAHSERNGRFSVLFEKIAIDPFAACRRFGARQGRRFRIDFSNSDERCCKTAPGSFLPEPGAAFYPLTIVFRIRLFFANNN